VRTWDENRVAINELWPLVQFTAEEKRLWTDDLSGLDQDSLYDAIRNVKRNNESNYPQLKWVRDEYRSLDRVRKLSSRRSSAEEPRQVVKIDADQNARMRDELTIVVDQAGNGDYESIVELIADKAAGHKIEMATAFGLVRYLQRRLGMANGGRIGDAA
jgi:hypothetical protein